ncbi:MAG TPA: 3-hydroxyacyl-CoA dehydrogenase NAD-binding domain-containing protein [Thermohalobaculum sp.]|nr:3-hydroxyacyl-CoA dehydrogenase NAD-binding domain-containing protein [Thermohalobaculum sp.]
MDRDMRLATLARPRLALGPFGEAGRSGRRLSLDRGDDGIAWLLLDREDTAVNTFDARFFEELDAALKALEADPPKALVIRSSKPAGFAMGADVNEFRGLTDRAEAAARVAAANALYDRLERLATAKIAVIHGTCAGGGTELVLCCDLRLAIADASLSLPEIRLGLHPGLGGTARLSHLIDPVQAMTLMLTGGDVSARRAKRLGLVDAVIEERHVENALAAAIAGKLAPHRPGWRDRALRTRPVRMLAAWQMRRKADAKARPEHYPAPQALIHLWEEHGGDRAAMLEAERASFTDLLTGDTAQALFRVFALRGHLRARSRGTGHDPGHGIAHVHVVGAGVMGGEIAAWCALKGFRVTFTDPDLSAMGKAYAAACKLYERQIPRPPERIAARDRLIWDPRGAGAAQADLVIEAAPEKPELKRRIYFDLEPRLKAGAILATNTSSLSLKSLAEPLKRPQNFLALHFFNPVSRMPLVEVARHDATADAAFDRALAFTGALAKLPAPVAAAPGFLVNRVLMPYLLEALTLLDEGLAREAVDEAAEAFGMPMGPIELADQVGLDICLAVARTLGEAQGSSAPAIPRWLEEKVEKGELGRKTGAGLYAYRNGKAQKDRPKAPAGPQITDRLILPMLNTTVACLREGVVADADTADAGMIFGAGFAPFRGGPLAYARARGIAHVVERLDELAKAHGPRFAPDAGWEALGEPGTG